MDDVVTPDFHKRIADGEIINNPCTFQKTLTQTVGSGMVTTHATGGGTGWTTWSPGVTGYWLLRNAGGNFSNPQSAFDALNIYVWLDEDTYNTWISEMPTTAMIESAKLQALKNIDRVPGNFGEDLYEWRETLEFLRSPLHSLSSLAKSFRKDVRKHPNYWSKRLQAIDDVYLQYRFAFSPLMQSAMQLYSVLINKKDQTDPIRSTARGFSKFTDQWYGEKTQNVHFGGVYEVHTQTKQNVKAGVMYEIEHPMHNWSWRLGLRLSDIPYIVWQVVPYSFMVDRVFDISSGIEAMRNLTDPSIKILAGFVTKTNESIREVTLKGLVNTSGHPWEVSPDTLQQTFFRYVRSPWTPTVSDTVPPQTWKNLVKDVSSIADLAALVYQRLKF
jgi:hypothetical protein